MTPRLADKLSFRRKLLLASVAIGTVAAFVAFGLVYAPQIRAQSRPTTDASLPSFEVASIKPNRSGDLRSKSLFLPGRFTATGITMTSLISMAYHVKSFQISGEPAWVSSERFDIIEAKEPDAIAKEMPKLSPQQSREKEKIHDAVAAHGSIQTPGESQYKSAPRICARHREKWSQTTRGHTGRHLPKRP